jgi:hypothetical protein
MCRHETKKSSKNTLRCEFKDGVVEIEQLSGDEVDAGSVAIGISDMECTARRSMGRDFSGAEGKAVPDHLHEVDAQMFLTPREATDLGNALIAAAETCTRG